MELSRRDAVAALAAIGIGGAVAYTQLDGANDGPPGDGSRGDGSPDAPGDSTTLVETAVALGNVLYPPEVDGVETFVRTYVRGRTDDDDARRTAMTDAVATLDTRADEEYGAPFRDLDPADGDALLEGMDMENVDPDPEGSDRERVRYYLVNELLYALMTSPKGGALVGIESPPGYPGGLDAYQQGPQG
ncbi:MAG: gluconate 2-dehydrogenase subunit 3 family protein [Haloarculaceae archaeon]